jgi:hypothetical protein
MDLGALKARAVGKRPINCGRMIYAAKLLVTNCLFEREMIEKERIGFEKQTRAGNLPVEIGNRAEWLTEGF